MTKRHVWWSSVAIAAGALLTFLFLASQPPDANTHVRVVDRLREIRAAEEELARLVLQKRGGLLENYDPILASTRRLDSLVRTVRSELDAEDPEAGRGLFKAYEALSVERRDAVERFKSADAVFRNSQAYLRFLSRDLTRRARSEGRDDVAQAIEDWEGAVLLRLHRNEEIGAALGHATPDLVQVAGELPALASDMRLLVAHAEAMLGSNRTAASHLARILALSKGERPDAIYARHMQRFFALERRAAQFAVVFYLCAILTAGGVMVVLARLQRTTRHLKRSNALLDARAGELETLAAQLQAEIDERQRSQAERDRLHSQLLQSQKMEALGTLAGGIAHELNNMLLPIIALTEIRLAALPGSEKAERRNVEIVLQAAERARDLAGRILAFSRSETATRQSARLATVVKDAMDMLRSVVPVTIRLRSTLSDVPEVQVDAGAIQQVIVNLVNNAAQAIGARSGTIDISLSLTADSPSSASQILLAIEDDGCGMDEATQRRALEPFFTTKPVGQGTGLGLSVVHGIVANHNGSITLDSQVGRGTRIEVRIPVEPHTIAVSNAREGVGV